MDGETPSLPVTGEWTVGHHPYRLQGDGRWDTIPTGYRGMDGGTPSLAIAPTAFAALLGRPPPGKDRGLSARTYSITQRFRTNRAAFLLRVPFFREFFSPSRSSPQAPSCSPCRDCWVLQPVGRWRSGPSDPNPIDHFARSLSTSNCGVPSRVKLTRMRPLALETSVWNSFGVRTGS